MSDNIQWESAKRLLAIESYKESLKRQWDEREKEWARLFDNKKVNEKQYGKRNDVVLLEWAAVGECDGKHESIKAVLDCGDCSKMLDVLS